ncbi:GIY-YIG nuclease family protein [Pseudoalteromonas aurantia]|uniref:GIY-YIG nuclease family protein n=1 Tax=Pseudoalteromonas aurantia TaxID=43654 RepID=UPI00110BE610|nr:GIY-YIG nuclease family protein [Pseudoalteromonas aurantia]
MNSSCFVYLIVCDGDLFPYIKIGKTVNLYNRLANIKTGCPHHISHAFVIGSKYEEEVIGLEGVLHKLLPKSHKGEWYVGNSEFFHALEAILHKVNSGFSYDEIADLQDVVTGPEFEILLHHHDFEYRKVRFPLKKSDCVMRVSRNWL